MIRFHIPRRFLRGSGGRLVLTVLALTCGVALVSAIELVNRAVLRAFAEVIDTAAGRAALQVTTEEGGLFPEDTATLIESIPGVELAVPVVTATAVTTEEPAELLNVHALDLLNEDALRVYEAEETDALRDPLVFLNAPDSILVTRAFAERRSLQLDDELRLDTATGRRSFTVRGLLEPKGVARAFGGNLIVQDLLQAQQIFARPGFVNRVDVVVAREADVETVAEAMRAALPAGLGVETPVQRKANLRAVIQSMQMLLRALSLVALAAAFMIAFNRLSAVFAERAWQLGVLRALGARRRVVQWELVKESLLLGAAGVALGIPLGVLLGRAILPVIAATMALNYRTVAPAAEVSLHPMSFVPALVLGIGTALFAALLPAWRAARVSVAETLRGRGVEQAAVASRTAWITRGMLAAGIAATVVLQSWTGDAAWGLAATILIVIATKVVALPLLELVTTPVLARTGDLFGVAGRFAARNLSRNPRRSALTVAMVAIGLGTVLWLGFVAKSFETTAVNVFRQSMQADLVVSSAHIGSGALEVPVHERLGEELLAIDGVASVVGVRLTNWHYAGGPVVLDAFDPDYFTNGVYGEWPLHGKRLPGAWDMVARGEAVVVSSNFVRNIAGDVGDVIELATPNGPLQLTVAGVTTDFASPRGTIEISRAIYREYWNDPTVTRFFVDVGPEAAAATVRSAVTARLGGRHNLRIISSGELVEYWAAQVRRAFAGVYVLGLVILAVVILGIADNLSAGVTERTRELGVFRSLGLRRRGAGTLIVAEALVLSGLGLLLALAQGFAIARLWVDATLPYLLGWVIHFTLPLLLLFGVMVTAMISCTIASLLPARKAARLEPAAALRWE